jgi:hypothetical protein
MLGILIGFASSLMSGSAENSLLTLALFCRQPLPGARHLHPRVLMCENFDVVSISARLSFRLAAQLDPDESL